MYNNKKENPRAILVIVQLDKNMNIEETKNELASLCHTAHIEPVAFLHQNRDLPDGRYFIGEGKVEELKTLIKDNNANLIVFENELISSKLKNLSEALNVKIIDRSMLILDIFAERARTNEGQIQVELAQLKYSLPRLGALIDSSNRYGGGVGMRGPGETKIELNRRIVENNILKKGRELKKLKEQRQVNRQTRVKAGKPMVAIVGYTNSGKSSLLNLLAKENVFVENELFATLDTTSRNIWLAPDKEVVLTDTVGFINNLPHEFIDAFGSTLEESKYADLLVHVVDISNSNYLQQMEVTINVLKKLGANAPILTVYNKIDKLDENSELINSDINGIYISVKKQINIDTLKNKIISSIWK